MSARHIFLLVECTNAARHVAHCTYKKDLEFYYLFDLLLLLRSLVGIMEDDIIITPLFLWSGPLLYY